MRTLISYRPFAPVLVVLVALGSYVQIQARAQAEARERTIFVSAVDDKRQPVDQLSISDFVVREDGQRREVLRVSRAVEPMDIALLVDNSAATADAVVQIRQALRQFIADMAGENQIAIVALADRPTILVDYTSDTKRLEDGIGRLFPTSGSGMTLLDAIIETSRGLERRDSSRAVLVPVLTDGVEFTNRYHRDVVAAAIKAGAAIHAVTIGQFMLTGGDADRERALVLDMGTRDTGGQRITLLSPNGLEDAMGRLARELRAQYKVVYGRPQSLVPPEKIEVSSARPGVTLRSVPIRTKGTAS